MAWKFITAVSIIFYGFSFIVLPDINNNVRWLAGAVVLGNLIAVIIKNWPDDLEGTIRGNIE